jgi:integrase
MELPKNEGWYLKRGMVYLAIRVQREKFVYATGWKIDDSSITARKLEDFKKGRIADASQLLGVTKIQRNVTVSALFKSYLEYLRRHEQEKGDYTTEERTNSERAEGQIEKHMIPFFGKLLPKDVQSNLMRYRLQRESENASPSTVNGEFRLLRAALRRGWKENKVRQEALPREYPFNYDGEKDSARSGTYTDEQVQCLVNNATPQFKPLFMTLVLTGLRPKEARWIKRADVLLNDVTPRILVLKHKTVAKTRKPKIVAIVDELLPVLTEWEAATQGDYPDCEWFFHVNGKRFDADALETEWDKVRKACGIPTKGVMLYDARRTHSVLLDAAGVSRDDRKTQMGHSTDAMSDAYNKTSIAHVKRIRAAFGSKPAQDDAQPVPTLPAPYKEQETAFDWKGELRDLKEAFDAGLMPEDLYRAEVAAVLRRRSEVR